MIPKHFKIAMLILILNAILVGCVGYTPPVIPDPETDTQPFQPTTRPSQAPTATRTLKPPTPLPTPNSSLGLQAEDLRGEIIRFWYVRGEGDLASLVDQFNRSNAWGISVRAEPFADDTELTEKIQANLYGELPDLASIYPYQVARLNSGGKLLVDLTPYVADRDWGFREQEVADFPPLVWRQDVIAGKRLGFPFYQLAQVFYYNQTWAEELGFKQPPGTPQDFQAQVCAAARANGGEQEIGARSGGWLVDTDTATLAGWIFAFGGEIDAAGGKGYAFNTSTTRQAFGFLRGLLDTGCAWTGDNLAPYAEFAARKALVITGSVTGLSSQAAELSDAGSRDRWTVLPFSSLQGQPVVDTYGPSLSILHSTPQKQLAAWAFLKWLVSPETQASLVRSSGVLPVRLSAEDRLGAYKNDHPQWAAALNLLPFARLEPDYPSWKTVRLVLSDAGKQLFSPSLKADEIPGLIKMLDATAAEIHEQTR